MLQKYKVYSGKKVPHFFMYAKNKTTKQVEEIGKCNIDRISNIVKSNRIVFKNLLDKYSYKMLMTNSDVDCKTDKANKILELYRELENTNLRKLSHVDFSSLDIDEKKRALLQLEFDTNKQRSMFMDIVGESKEYITDVLVKLLQDNINKDTLWRLFGEVIYSNLERNLKGTKICCKCNTRFNATNNRAKFCEECSKDEIKKRDRLRKLA